MTGDDLIRRLQDATSVFASPETCPDVPEQSPPLEAWVRVSFGSDGVVRTFGPLSEEEARMVPEAGDDFMGESWGVACRLRPKR